MLISILAMGSRGDVQPYVALGAGLLTRGFRVRVACSQPYRSLVEAVGLEYAALPGDPRAALATQQGQAWLAANPARRRSNVVSTSWGAVWCG